MNIKKFFTLAKNASTFSDFENIKIGSVLVYKNKVVSVGYNIKKSHPYQKILNRYRNQNGREFDVNKRNNYLHSEMNCLRNVERLNINFNKCYLFIYRENKDGSLDNCYPCKSCQMRLKELGINRIFYTDKDGYNYKEI